MTSLLHFASRVQAASEAYISVRDFADKQEWKAKFRGEMKSSIREFQRISKNAGTPPPLHPILVALTIVLNQDEDLGRINVSHPKRNLHEFYNPEAEFPDDLSGLLPGGAERWWEHLAEADRKANASKNPPQPAQPPQRKVRLIVPAPPPHPEEDEDVTMAVEEKAEASADSQDRGRSKVSKAAAATRKRKGSSVGASGREKRHAQSRQRPDSAEKGSGGSNGDGPVEEVSGQTPTLECDRCKNRGEICVVLPDGPCQRCKIKKQGCSLMPLNPSTGKTDRHAMSKAELLEFRLKQAEGPCSEVKKGKRRAHDSAEPIEGDTSVPSPSVSLAHLGTMTLDSGSSHANTPEDSPATLSQPPLPEHPAPAPPPAPKTRTPKTSRTKSVSKPPATAPTRHLAGTSQLLKPVHRQASRSSGDVSPASDDVSNEARIAALESRMDEMHAEMKKWADEFDSRLSNLGA